jgi:hypothetical protein
MGNIHKYERELLSKKFKIIFQKALKLSREAIDEEENEEEDSSNARANSLLTKTILPQSHSLSDELFS